MTKEFEFDLQRFAEADNKDTQPTDKQGTEQTQTVDQKEVKDEKKVEDIKDPTEDKINKLIDEKSELLKNIYEKKVQELEATRKSLDKKVSEQSKVISEYKKKEMTEEQLKELEKQEMKRAWQKLYIAQTIAKFNLNKDDEDMDFASFLYSDKEEPEKMEEELIEKGKLLREYLDKVIKAGIDRGVNERIAQGYKPKSSSEGNKTDDFENMSKNDIAKKINEIMKMPSSPEKDAILQKAMMEQSRRLSQ